MSNEDDHCPEKILPSSSMPHAPEKDIPHSLNDIGDTQVINNLPISNSEIDMIETNDIYSSDVQLPTSQDYENVTADKTALDEQQQNQHKINQTDEKDDEVHNVHGTKSTNDEYQGENGVPHTSPLLSLSRTSFRRFNVSAENEEAKAEIMNNIDHGGDNSWLDNAKDPFGSTQSQDELKNNTDIILDAQSENSEADDTNDIEQKAHEVFEKLREQANQASLVSTQNSVLNGCDEDVTNSTHRFDITDDTQRIDPETQASYIKFTLEHTQQHRLSLNKLKNILKTPSDNEKLRVAQKSTQIIFDDTQNLNDAETQKINSSPINLNNAETQKIVSSPIDSNDTEAQKFIYATGSSTSCESQKPNLFLVNPGEAETQKIGSSLPKLDNSGLQESKTNSNNAETQKIYSSPTNLNDNETQKIYSSPTNLNADTQKIESLKDPWDHDNEVQVNNNNVIPTQSSEGNNEPDIQIPATIEGTNDVYEPQFFSQNTSTEKNQVITDDAASQGSYEKADETVNQLPLNIDEKEQAKINSRIGDGDGDPQSGELKFENGLEVKATQRSQPQEIIGADVSSIPTKEADTQKILDENIMSSEDYYEPKKTQHDFGHSQSIVIEESSPAIRATDVITFDTPTRSSFQITLGENDEKKSPSQDSNPKYPITHDQQLIDRRSEDIQAAKEHEGGNPKRTDNVLGTPRHIKGDANERFTSSQQTDNSIDINTLKIEDNSPGMTDDDQEDTIIRGGSRKRKIRASGRGDIITREPRKRMIVDDSEDDESEHDKENEKEKSQSMIFPNKLEVNQGITNKSENKESKRTILREENEANYTEDSEAGLSRETASVWATYDFHYYPAKVIRNNNYKCEVQFYDDDIIIKKEDICSPLDIKIGDTVKIHAGNDTHIVTGLGQTSEVEATLSCVRGFNCVYLRKLVRNLPSDKHPEICVDLWEIYMTDENWLTRLDSPIAKNYLVKPLKSGTVIRPSVEPSDLSRSKVKTFKSQRVDHNISKSEQFYSYVSSAETSPVKTVIKSRIFENTAFCLTGDLEADRVRLTQLIMENGGVVLKDGFSAMLSVNRDVNGNIEKIEVVNQYKNIKFAAVIARSYSRSVKYLQILALGWPALSKHFIFQCVEKSRWLDDWYGYQLIAGESKYLDTQQSLRTQMFEQNYLDPDINGIQHQLDNKRNILRDYTVLMVSIKPSVCELFFFLLGAEVITSVGYNEALLKMVRKLKKKKAQRSHKFLFYDYITVSKMEEKLQSLKNKAVSSNIETFKTKKRSSRKRAKTEQGTSSTSKSKKSIFSRRDKEDEEKPTEVTLGLVDWEWVVQCLISSCKWEPVKEFVLY
ncbi:chromatin-binding protein [Saccharomycopsis crataegensis]|uniref:Chromatin-binding protein n=1 Tax=Saccharomycopsis crataegensis TaxID=43959 RepID=A0AAV5QQR2_9ASCO|nr:chromatin-binding protein [Saccharomycopsis crataegensis]